MPERFSKVSIKNRTAKNTAKRTYTVYNYNVLVIILLFYKFHGKTSTKIL